MRIFLEFSLPTREWGDVSIARVIPDGDDYWGHLSILRGTPWGDEISVVSGEDFSHALHGHATPLMRSLGRPPKIRLKRIPPEWRPCEAAKGCIAHQAHRCYPCGSVPDCYVPPMLTGEAQKLAAAVALAWRDGFYVIVVKGPEFTL